MEKNQIMMKEKLGLFGILKETLTILYKNPSFIILTFLTSLPLFCSLLAHEIIFDQTLIETAKFRPQESSYKVRCSDSANGMSSCFYQVISPLDTIKEMIEKVTVRYLLLGLSYLGIVHLLDLFSTIVIVNSASVIYAGEKRMNLKERWHRSIGGVRLKGPLITSIYALLMSSLSLLGLVSLVTHFYMTLRAILIAIFFGLLSIACLAKHMEWNAIWNMGVVMSVLEEKQGVIALGVSAYVSRGCRRRGLSLMLIFFVWRLALRLSCLYVGWSEGGSGIVVTAVQVSLVCFGNVLKWVAFMVYFYDCKKRFLEKKVDVEQGSAAEVLK
ncbi:hypothetical protein PVL29_019164 [Vitis rotundifolia]|uniref:Transmembrane protein n=1 Tax=Vitis rotundifolia TaxID=103349 RepID=A0AA39DIL8_VITRO|nr:hypothetical protein PVL29_019164 [Vitis rotundifolia]